jgi:hypothetical protein
LGSRTRAHACGEIDDGLGTAFGDFKGQILIALVVQNLLGTSESHFALATKVATASSVRDHLFSGQALSLVLAAGLTILTSKLRITQSGRADRSAKP